MSETADNRRQAVAEEAGFQFDNPSCPLPESEVEDLSTVGDHGSQQADIKPDMSEMEEKLQQAEARATEQKDAWLRAMAEMENLRKRMNREIDNARKFALEGFAKDLLSVADNLERALAAVSTGDEAQMDKLTEGVRLIQSEVLRTFGKHGITRLEALNQPFDPHMHQAMMEVADGQAAPGTVVYELQAGYLLNERLLRPAMVGIAKAP